MTFAAIDWQNVVALGLVALAALYLGWQAVHQFAGRKARSCGQSCAGCPVPTVRVPAPPASVIPVDQLASSGQRLSSGNRH